MSLTDQLAQLNISVETITQRGLREYIEAADLVLVEVAVDGREHLLTPTHTGCAIDIATLDHPLLETSFAHTAEFGWLTQNAGRFGFTLSFPEGNVAGYQYEPWHWCFHQR